MNNDRIMEWKFNATTGRVVAGGNGPGNRTDQLSGPTSVAVVHGTNRLIICDQGNKRVMQWSRGNKNGETIIPNAECVGLAVDNQNFIYIPYGVHNGAQEVRRYQMGETNGIVVAGGNGVGDRLSQLSSPTDVFVDGVHSVYVFDKNNARVMKWDKNATAGIVVAGFQGSEAVALLSMPSRIFVDPLGAIYVTDHNPARVIRWCKGDIKGKVIYGEKWEKPQDRLIKPNGLAMDRQGNLYVADTDNHRIQRFSFEAN